MHSPYTIFLSAFPSADFMQDTVSASAIVACVLGLLCGAALMYAFMRQRAKAQINAAITNASKELRAREDAHRQQNYELGTRLAACEQQLVSERAAAADKLATLDAARESLAAQFKLVATEIMEGNAKRFAEHSQQSLGELLNPLRTKLSDFQQKVEEVYVNEGKDRAALKEQVQQLVGLNQALSEDARNLTSALRGSNKHQGNWGELILQRILEQAGLREGAEFVLQDSQQNDEGKRQQPDVVIQLPEGRRIIVDAKVSLIAFERAASANTDEERASAMREHLQSVRAHIRGLADKKYDQLYGTSLDFVVMFVPIEPAFMLAVTNDERLSFDAWDRNVLLVSPSTLLFVLRTVAYLWRQEAQSRNAKDIAKRGADMYDRLVGFVSDLNTIGARLDAAQQAYADARKKLSSGKGNVIRQAELLRELGVKPNKQLPRDLLDASGNGDTEAEDDAVDADALALPAPLVHQAAE
jgi:DNA recombination protein RmuC